MASIKLDELAFCGGVFLYADDLSSPVQPTWEVTTLSSIIIIDGQETQQRHIFEEQFSLGSRFGIENSQSQTSQGSFQSVIVL